MFWPVEVRKGQVTKDDSMRLFFVLLVMFCWQMPGYAQTKETPAIIGYVSLQYERTNGREGPGKAYPVAWEYHRKGMPMAVLRRASEWTRVMDVSGDIVWMANSVLRSRASAVVISQEPAQLLHPKRRSKKVLALLEPGVVVRVSSCSADACRIKVQDYDGLVAKGALWGNLDPPPE